MNFLKTANYSLRQSQYIKQLDTVARGLFNVSFYSVVLLVL